MATLYSARFFDVGESSAGESDSQDVPSGFVWVVRDIQAWNYQAPPQALSGFRVQRASGGIIFAVGPIDAQAGRLYQWQGRAVLNAGEVLTEYFPDAEWSMMISGFALTAP